MDYDQDYSKLNNADNKWYDFDGVATAPANHESATIPCQISENAERSPATLDNEDFD